MAALIFTQYDQVYVLEFDATTSETHDARAEISKHRVQRGKGSGVAVSDNVVPEPLVVRVEGVITNTPLNRTFAERYAASVGGKKPIVVGDVFEGRAPRTIKYRTRRQTSTATAEGGNLINLPPAINNQPQLAALASIPLVGSVPRPVKVTLGKVVEEENSISFQTTTLSDVKMRLRVCLEALQWANRYGIPVKLVTEEKEYPVMLISAVSAVKNTAYDMMRFSVTVEEINFATVRTTTAKVKLKQPLQKRMEEQVDQGQASAFTPTGTPKERIRSRWLDSVTDRTTQAVDE